MNKSAVLRFAPARVSAQGTPAAPSPDETAADEPRRAFAARARQRGAAERTSGKGGEARAGG